jgi:hypothetical protein
MHVRGGSLLRVCCGMECHFRSCLVYRRCQFALTQALLSTDGEGEDEGDWGKVKQEENRVVV